MANLVVKKLILCHTITEGDKIMKCIFCGCNDSKVIDSRNVNDTAVRRRRQCLNCKKRYTTYEMLEANPMMVTNVFNEREAFRLEKLIESLEYAFYCTEFNSINEIGELALKIEKDLLALNKQEINTSEIVEVVSKSIKEIDELAYLVYYVQHTDCKSLSDVRSLIL